MPSTSSSFARVEFLDARATVERLRRAAERLAAANPRVRAVLLFGSLATGGATPASDADLLVIVDADARRVLDRIPEYARAFEDVGVPTQVLPWTTDELTGRLGERDPFAAEILRTGVVLAGTLPQNLP
ncbi:MAG: nucleotidyltransferase domain-containing protein [Gemmatimonadales bacterium]